MKNIYKITVLFLLLLTLIGCGNEPSEEEIIEPVDITNTIHIDMAAEIQANAQEKENDASNTDNPDEINTDIEELISQGALALYCKTEIYETESSLSEEELSLLQEKGKVSDFGLQIKYSDDYATSGEYEYVPGYIIITYFLEDGTEIYPSEEEPFIYEDINNTRYTSILLSFDTSEPGFLCYVMEEQLYNSLYDTEEK